MGWMKCEPTGVDLNVLGITVNLLKFFQDVMENIASYTHIFDQICI